MWCCRRRWKEVTKLQKILYFTNFSSAIIFFAPLPITMGTAVGRSHFLGLLSTLFLATYTIVRHRHHYRSPCGTWPLQLCNCERLLFPSLLFLAWGRLSIMNHQSQSSILKDDVSHLSSSCLGGDYQFRHSWNSGSRLQESPQDLD